MRYERILYRVLICDDNDIYPYNLRTYIEELCSYSTKIDINVDITRRAQDALHLIQNGSYDLIVLDTCISPPSNDRTIDEELRDKARIDYYGYSLYRAVKEFCPYAKVFAVSKLDIINAKNEFHHARDVDYFCKHYTFPRQIAQAIVNYFETGKKRILNHIFVVYGHQHEMRKTVTNFIQDLQINILDIYNDAPGGIRTVFDCLERSSSKAECAIVLLSGDDLCVTYDNTQNAHAVTYRSRQNVIFELGLFSGALGKDRVIVLYESKKQFEFPSDIDGLFYIEYDKEGTWRELLLSDLKKIGFYG